MDITVFLGAPGSGKGTQAKRLASSGNYEHLSTGDMLRASIVKENSVGLKAKSFMDKGELVPDQVMIEIIEDTLKSLPQSKKILLDGFPRTLPQAQALDNKEKTKVNRAIYFKIPETVLVQRLAGRRVCAKCGESFHVINMPPKNVGICDKCQGPLAQRPDDSENVVAKRLEVFNKQNSQLLGYYAGEKKLYEVNANRSADEVLTDISNHIS